MSSTTTIFGKFNTFCEIVPPIYNTATDLLVNLPILLLYLITLPVRFFICQFSAFTGINFVCALINLLPPFTMLCPLFTANQSESSCYGDCKYCLTSECLQYPQTVANICIECQQSFSILNKIFCNIGVLLYSFISPVTVIINVFLVPIIGKQFCINVNPYICE